MPTTDQLELSPSVRAYANTLRVSGAFKEGDFRLKLHELHPDAPLSPYYLSQRRDAVVAGYFDPLCNTLARAVYENCREQLDQADWILGIPKAGDPLADALAKLSKKPVLRMEKDESGDTRRITSRINGEFRPGQSVFGIDDLVTEADTKFEFAQALLDNGLVLVHIGVGIDREQGGIQRLRDSGISCSAALPISTMLDYYLHAKPPKISQESYDRINAYRLSQSSS